ncbi:hypothetical protein FRB90_010037, partial [Tulasnella sp. 427]
MFTTYPIFSVSPIATSVRSNIITLSFYPDFGAFNDELYEEYLEHTVISGVAATGGLYTALDLVFGLIFGRSLLAVILGGKQLTPFGMIATLVQGSSFHRRLQASYPGIDGKEPDQKARATCDFIHDVLLDLKPLDIKPTQALLGSNKESQLH